MPAVHSTYDKSAVKTSMCAEVVRCGGATCDRGVGEDGVEGGVFVKYYDRCIVVASVGFVCRDFSGLEVKGKRKGCFVVGDLKER